MALIDNSPSVAPPDHELEAPRRSHIVKKDGGNGRAVVLEARITGTPVEALCGFVFVPHKNPKDLPMCDMCKEIYDMERSFDERLNESPEEA